MRISGKSHLQGIVAISDPVRSDVPDAIGGVRQCWHQRQDSDWRYRGYSYRGSSPDRPLARDRYRCTGDHRSEVAALTDEELRAYR